MVEELVHCQRLEFDRTDMDFLLDKVAHSPAGPSYQAYLIWTLAATGRERLAKQHLNVWIERELAFDANWISAQAEAAEAIVVLGDPAHAQRVYDRLAPYAGRPATSGRAVMSYGAIDRQLGGLAAAARPPRRRDRPSACRDRARGRARLHGLAAALAPVAQPCRARRPARGGRRRRGAGARDPGARDMTRRVRRAFGV